MTEEKKPNKDLLDKWNIVSLATELGFIIALPIVALALAGKWLDQRYDSFPWFTLSGIILAIITTTIWLVKRLKTYIR